MKKNYLEKLFQERLKDFREIPDEKVWESLSASLDNKKKKRVIPIWWKLGSVAAVLALLFYIVNPFEEDNSIDQVVDIEKPAEKSSTPIKNSEKTSSDPIKPIQDANITSTANTGENKDHIVVERASSVASNTNKKGAPSGFNTTAKTLAAYEVEKERLETKSKIDLPTPLENSNAPQVVFSTAKEEKIISKLKEDFSKKDAVVVVDSETSDDKKSIFDVIEEQKEEEIAASKNKENKWSIGPSVAPVYFDAIGQGSPIDSDFVQNSKSGDVNLSYGLDVAYNVGKRLKIRSGIHKVDYGYNTNEIIFSSTLNASSQGSLDNINFSQAIIVESNKSNRSTLIERSVSDFSSENQIRDGRLAQQLGYLEVPVELNYALVDKKLGVNLIGGLSSLFLVDNSVALESDGLVTEIGEANNINSVNFSTNVGVGFSYEFSPKIQINLEPIFKYQLNTFSETSGSFNPYSLGVYSGMRFNF